MAALAAREAAWAAAAAAAAAACAAARAAYSCSLLARPAANSRATRTASRDRASGSRPAPRSRSSARSAQSHANPRSALDASAIHNTVRSRATSLSLTSSTSPPIRTRHTTGPGAYSMASSGDTDACRPLSHSTSGPSCRRVTPGRACVSVPTGTRSEPPATTKCQARIVTA